MILDPSTLLLIEWNKKRKRRKFALWMEKFRTLKVQNAYTSNIQLWLLILRKFIFLPSNHFIYRLVGQLITCKIQRRKFPQT